MFIIFVNPFCVSLIETCIICNFFILKPRTFFNIDYFLRNLSHRGVICTPLHTLLHVSLPYYSASGGGLPGGGGGEVSQVVSQLPALAVVMWCVATLKWSVSRASRSNQLFWFSSHRWANICQSYYWNIVLPFIRCFF